MSDKVTPIGVGVDTLGKVDTQSRWYAFSYGVSSSDETIPGPADVPLLVRRFFVSCLLACLPAWRPSRR